MGDALRAGGAALGLLAESFRYNDAEFLHEDVTHLGRYAKRTSVNLIPVSDSLKITVHLRDRSEPLVMRQARRHRHDGQAERRPHLSRDANVPDTLGAPTSHN